MCGEKEEGKEKVGGGKGRIGVRETDLCSMRGCLGLGMRVSGVGGREGARLDL